MSKGLFIVFEGGEGSGKTNHVQRTAKWLENKNHTVLQTHEPGGSELGKKIRNLLLDSKADNIHPRSELFLFLADRSEHIESVIKPALTEQKIILCDRFTGSTFAYQIGARRLTGEEVIKATEQYSRDNIEPDIVIYLDVDPEVGMQRKLHQPKHEMSKFDSETIIFHSKVRSYFQKLAENEDNWTTINANQTLDEVQSQVEKVIGELL
ncbi:MAG: dTMP kinase [bacterium]|nr:dTMP kinase [bacterium]